MVLVKRGFPSCTGSMVVGSDGWGWLSHIFEQGIDEFVEPFCLFCLFFRSIIFALSLASQLT